MNTYVRDYKLNNIGGNLVEGLDSTKFITDYAMQCVEYTNSDGISFRSFACCENNDLINNKITLEIQTQLFNSGEWVNLASTLKITAKRVNGKFTRLVDQETVDIEDAIDIIDDLSNELLNSTGESCDPKRYMTKRELKAGYKNEFDYFAALFGSGSVSHHDIHKSMIIKNFDIQFR